MGVITARFNLYSHQIKYLGRVLEWEGGDERKALPLRAEEESKLRELWDLLLGSTYVRLEKSLLFILQYREV